MIKNVYRLEVKYPKGAFDDDYAPEGWAPNDFFSEHYGQEFFWPCATKIYHSRSTARSRAHLLERFGATVTIRRSVPITWEYSEAEVLRDRVAELEEFITELKAVAA